MFFEKTYDSKGNLETIKVPNANGTSFITTTYGYNAYNQLTSKNISGGIGITNYAHSTSAGDYIIATTPPSGKFNTTTYDATGKKVKVIDAGGTMNYNYNATDDILEVLNGTNKVIECTYDIYGRQTGLKDKDINSSVVNQYEYDGWGNLIKQIDTKNNKTEQTFDNWGRLLTQKLTDGTTTIATTTTNTYRTTSPGLNQLNTITGFNGITETYGYDALNRPNSVTKNFEGVNYTTSYVYDGDDRIKKITYPSGFAANYTYNANGFLTTVKNTNNTKTLYSATNINAYNQVTNFKLGNNTVSTHTYNDYGMPTDFITTGIQNLHMEYSNLATGNMTLRKDVLKNLTETFTYDNPTDRLLSMKLGTNTAKSIAYDGTGNITAKTDVGSEYIYGDANHIHAVTKIKSKVYNGPGLTDPQTEPSDISTDVQDISYTAFNQPNVLTEGTGTPLVKQLTYSYAADHQRIKSIYKENNTPITTRYYLGNYEKDITNGVTNEIHYVPTGIGLGCIMVKSGGVENFYYPYKDHQGSILKVVNEAGTTTLAEQSFDAWGRPRNPANWTYTGIPTTNPAWLYRGYTGHEMLLKFALINMNGRMYDYINARMLSPDNFVHDDQGTQGFNRYSYVFNNPLKYVDPTGEDGDEWDCPDWDDDRGRDDERDDRSYDEKLRDYWEDRFEESGANAEQEWERDQYDFERDDYNEEYDYDYLLENGGDDVRDNKDRDYTYKSDNDRDPIPWNYTVYNATDEPIYVKPESSSEPVKIEPHTKHLGLIDGLTVPGFENQVYKVKTGLEITFAVIAKTDGVHFYWFDKSVKELNEHPPAGDPGGWYNNWEDLGENWKPLFEKSNNP